MTGDMCATKHCGDLAAPGFDYCDGCLLDLELERELHVNAVRDLTEAHDRDVLEEAA